MKLQRIAVLLTALCLLVLSGCADSSVSSSEELAEVTTAVTTEPAPDPRELALEDAKAKLDAGDYADLVKRFSSGDLKAYASDSAFVTILQKADQELTAAVRKSVQEALDSADYYTASTEIEAQLKEYPDSEGLKALLDEIKSSQASGLVESTKENRDQYLERLDYQGAEKYVRMQIEMYPDVEELRDLLETLNSVYIEMAMARAEALYAEKDAEGAVALLDQVTESVGKNETVSNARSKYAYYAPAYLNNLRASDLNDTLPYASRQLTENECKDAHGNTYKSMFYLGTVGEPEKSSYAEYQLSGTYNEFRGTVAASYANKDSAMASSFRVYGDGRLLFVSPMSSANTAPKEFTVEVTGVQTLRIEYPAGMYAPNSAAAIFDARIRRRWPDEPAPATTAPLVTSTVTTAATTGTTAQRTWWTPPAAPAN